MQNVFVLTISWGSSNEANPFKYLTECDIGIPSIRFSVVIALTIPASVYHKHKFIFSLKKKTMKMNAVFI